jgi:DNA-binding NarL/FixJ family response regulator
MLRFLIVDDHPLFREALQSALQLAYPDAETVEARLIEEALTVLGEGQDFDLALLDLSIPGVQGFEGLLTIRTRYPRLPVVVVSGHEDPRVVSETLSYGAAGFIPKSARKDDLAKAIREVMEGEVCVPRNFAEQPDDPGREDRAELLRRLATLTPQQMRVLGMQIAYELQVGETTVKAHVSEILRKLHVYSRTQAVIEVSRLDHGELFRDAEEFGMGGGKPE